MICALTTCILTTVVWILHLGQADYICQKSMPRIKSGQLLYRISVDSPLGFGKNFLMLKLNHTGRHDEEIVITLRGYGGNEDNWHRLIVNLSPAPNLSYFQLRQKRTILPLIYYFTFEGPVTELVFMPVATGVMKIFVNGNPLQGKEMKFHTFILPFNELAVEKGGHLLNITQFCVASMECQDFTETGNIKIWSTPKMMASHIDSRGSLIWPRMQNPHVGVAVNYGYGIANGSSEFTLSSSEFRTCSTYRIKISNSETAFTFALYKNNYIKEIQMLQKTVSLQQGPPYHSFSIFPAIRDGKMGYAISVGNGLDDKFIIDDELYDTLKWKSQQKFKQLCIFRNYTRIIQWR